jgi:ABC-2 type transport system ATP-binding protein
MNVEVTGLTQRFGRTAAVAGMALRAGPGDAGCWAPSQGGKTSLLRMMATVASPSRPTAARGGRPGGGSAARMEDR